MQRKLAAGFLSVTWLFALVGLLVPRLTEGVLATTALTVSLYAAIGLGASWLLARSIGRRLTELAAAAADISKGDLTRRIDTRGTDEVAQLARSLAVMTQSLLDIVLNVQSTAEEIHGSARELSTATGAVEIEAGPSDRAPARTARAAPRLAEVERHAREIGALVGSIGAVASDAQLLAINAAIEGARAGEAGQGFGAAVEDLGRLAGDLQRLAERVAATSADLTVTAAAIGDQTRGNDAAMTRIAHSAGALAHTSEQLRELITVFKLR